MRSVVVVLPASMWAMMPMLRYFSSGVSRAIYGPEERRFCGAGVRVSREILQLPFTPTKTRVDRAPHFEAGVHPLPPGLATAETWLGTLGRAG
jgi:hypothetical protein